MAFSPSCHEPANKTIFGDAPTNYDATGSNGVNVMDRLFDVTKPQRLISAQFIAKKLFEFFAYEHPAQSIVDGLAATFVVNMSIDAVVRAILTHPEFYSVAARQ